MKQVKQLSTKQQRIFFIQEICKNIPLYNVSLLFQIEGSLNLALLEKSIQQLIDRHEPLRTKIMRHTNAHPIVQIVFAKYPFQLPPPLVVTESQLDREVQKNIEHLFHFSTDFLFRAKLFKVSEKHFLSLVLHHIIADGWSLKLITKELFLIYDHYARNQKLTLPTVNYDDNNFSSPKQNEQNLNFWKNELKDIKEVGHLLYDFPIKSKPDFTMRRQIILMEKSTIEHLYSLARSSKVTLFSLLFSIFQIVLFRYLQNEEIVIGTVSHGRTQSQHKNNLGFFVNTLPIRSQLNEKMRVNELIQQTHYQLLQAYYHQDIDFQHIVSGIDTKRVNTYFPLIQVIFMLQKLDMTYQQLGEINIQQLRSQNSVCPFPLMVLLRETQQGIQVTCNYHTALFLDSTIRTLLHLFEHLITTISTKSTIGDLHLVSDEQKRHVLAHNHSRSRQSHCVHQVFEEHASNTPQKIAIVCDGVSYSYLQINDRANQLATILSKKVGSQPRIAIILDRSVEYIVSIIAILKMGGTYIPINTNDPAFRVQYILNAVKPQMVISHSKYKLNFTNLYHIDNVNWASDCEFSSVYPDENSPAYIMFTSGSTGTPKGIIIPHRGILRLVEDVDYVNLKDVRILQMANLAFDASTFEIWSALLSGSCCIIYTQRHFSVDSLQRIIENESITTLWLTSSLFNLIIDNAPQTLINVKELLVGGEALSPKHITKALEELPNTTLINGYGPTENTVFTCCYKIPRDFCGKRSLPIGKPISNTQVYILDSNKKLVPPGITGELFTSGDGLALGYLDEELTKQKFIPNTIEQNQTMYATGDMCRYLENGDIEYVGRKDRQIKLRGFRIELSEIEYYLQMISGVKKALVRLITTPHKYIVGYVALEIDFKYQKEDMIRKLKNKLPDYMVPQTFVFMDEIPLTANGKIDYSALPQATHEEKQFVPPQGEVEQRIAQIWQAHLPQKKIGRLDDFFAIGGDSLCAIRIIPKIERIMGVKLEIENIFHYTTIKSFSEFLIAKNSNDYQHIVPIKMRDSSINFFCVHTGHGNVFQYYSLAEHLDCNFYGIRAANKFYPSMQKIAEAYISEIKKVQPTGPYYIGGACMGTIIAVEIVKLMIDKGDRVTILCLLDPGAPNAYKHSHRRIFIQRVKKAWEKIRNRQFKQLVIQAKNLAKKTFYTQGNSYHHQQKKIKRHILLLPKSMHHLPKQKAALFHVEEHLFARQWKKICPLLEENLIPGNHQNFFHEPHVVELAEKLNPYLR